MLAVLLRFVLLLLFGEVISSELAYKKNKVRKKYEIGLALPGTKWSVTVSNLSKNSLSRLRKIATNTKFVIVFTFKKLFSRIS